MRIKPDGWIRHFLETQLDGLTGHIEHAGFPFDRVRWGDPDYRKEGVNPSWWVYEQTAYWVDGLTRCALLLENQKYLNIVKEIILDVFQNADEDGYLGPKFLKENISWNRWPHVVFFRACMALYEYTEDEVILDKLAKHYLGNRVDYSNGRDVYNIEIMLWLYGKTGKQEFLTYAEETYALYNAKATDDNCDKQALSDKKPYAHGVTYNEYFKLGAILYQYTKNEKYLQISVEAYKKIDRYFMLPSGCHCSNEFLISNDYMQSSETCNVTDYTWALSYLLAATKDGSYADKIEKCIFNAGIGAVLEDFKGLQYFSCANQILADATSNHNTFFKGEAWMSYRPNPGTECCPGNVNRFMPNYLLNSWRQEGNRIYSLCYVPCMMETEINGKRICVTEKTNYPFNEKITYEVETESAFTLCLRRPKWATDFSVIKDGVAYKSDAKGEFLDIEINGNCQIEVAICSDIQKHKQQGKVWFSKGALVYSYGMKGDRQIDVNEQKSTAEFPAYNIYPDREWRYCITGEPNFVAKDNVKAFDLDTELPYIEVPAKIISHMELTHKTRVRQCYDLYNKQYRTKKGNFVFTPRLMSNCHMVLQDGSEQKIKLYPYGACKLRMTVFNYRKE